MRSRTLVVAVLMAFAVHAHGIPDTELSTIGIEQKLGAQLPLDTEFKDESGAIVRLSKYFGRRPAVLVLAYYSCANLCTVTLNGAVEGLRGVILQIGRDFDVIVVSINPAETPTLAADKKHTYSMRYGRPGSAVGWHFLTGDEPSIRRVAEAVGFHYQWDEQSRQFAHGSGLIIVTPQGKVSRYFLGIEYPPRQLSAALSEAASNRVGRLAERLLLLCFHYDPATGRYGFVIRRGIQVAGIGTVLLLGGLLFHLHRRAQRPPADVPC